MKRVLSLLAVASALCVPSNAAPAPLLFEDDFNRAITGWTVVQPPGNYIEGPARWQWDRIHQGWAESSNIYTDNATASPTGTAVMLINDAVVGNTYTYKARLIAGDDDAFGLVFGFQDPLNCYRITFARQNRGVGEANGYPFAGWHVDRKVENAPVRLFGAGTAGFTPSFVNRVNVPFDVTIQVTDRNLTITLVDDPDGAAPVTHTLVNNQPIPTTAGGKVGILTWGQASNNPSGFIVKNMELTPTALVNFPVPDLLAGWTEEIGVRNDGTSNIGGNGHGNWSLGLGVNGPLGVLLENVDTAPANDAAGQLDFISSMLTAGDVNWTDYVMTTRMIPSDDDGFGVVVRFKDNRNYYRVSLRRQVSGTGARAGLSIQKTVDGVWSEVYFDNPVRFNAPANVPFDMSVAVFGDTLQVLIVANPDGASPASYFYGPFTIADGVVANGKVGFFSWAMNTFRSDFVRVHGIEGVPLIVSSPYAVGDPRPGVNSYAAGTSVTASTVSPFEESPGVRRIVTGFTGIGDVPAAGTESTVTFTLNNLSALSWQWRTEYRVAATAGAGGTVTAPAEQWVAEGSPVTISAEANPGFVFSGWSGFTASRAANLSLTANSPITLAAEFAADTDNDGLPDAWENTNFGNLNSAANDDPDADRLSNLAEFQRGSAPNHAETLWQSDGLVSRWLNAQRDPGMAGALIIRDFGNGYRGVWENSNDYREATTNPMVPPAQRIPNVTFDGPRMIVRPDLWLWNDYTAQTVFSVGDNDGNCVYFRYKDDNNWYRATFNGNDAFADWRAPAGLSVQKRVNGVYSEIGRDPIMYADPTDSAFFKRFRITVKATGSNFEVRVVGWNVFIDPPAWDTSFEAVVTFTDPDHTTGTFGVGTWGQQGTAGGATATNPVDAGALIEEIVVTAVAGKGPKNEVFREEWETVPLPDALPVPPVGGSWQVTAHHSIVQLSDEGLADGPHMVFRSFDFLEAGGGLPPNLPVNNGANYFLEMGFHPFDDDGIGFVYNYTDANNYSRVLFSSQASAPGRLARGLTVSRKANGVWSDVIAGDPAFVYTPGAPFHVEFSSFNGAYGLRAWNVDNPTAIQSWSWSGPASASSQGFGPATWQSIDAHFTHLRAYTLPDPSGGGGEIRVTGTSFANGQLTLNVSNTTGRSYRVLRSSDVTATGWTEVAAGQTGATWSTAVPATGNGFYILQSTP